MRVLHLVKTSDGARWAAEQVKVLVREGHEIGVILPSPRGTQSMMATLAIPHSLCR